MTRNCLCLQAVALLFEIRAALREAKEQIELAIASSYKVPPLSLALLP